jgi:hypothetical protein
MAISPSAALLWLFLQPMTGLASARCVSLASRSRTCSGVGQPFSGRLRIALELQRAAVGGDPVYAAGSS